MPVNELQLALIGAGVGVVALVWIYNLLQERKHKKVAEKIFKGGQPDVLLEGQEEEGLAEPQVERPAARIGGDADERIEPGMGAAVRTGPREPALSVPVGTPPAPPEIWADDIADCTLRIEFAEPVAAPELWSRQAEWAGELSKSLNWLGYDAGRGEWRRLTAHDAGHYLHVAVAAQLADRQGPVSEAEVEAFIEGVQRLAQALEGEVTLPVLGQVLEHAQALDGFCASVDVQLAVNVVETAGGSFMGTKLRGLAEAAGMKLESDGRFHARDDLGNELFTLSNLGKELFEADSLRTLASQGVSFVLDVPRVVDGPAVFDRMVGAARMLAQPLGGTLVDGQRHVLSEPMIEGIRKKVGEIQRQMAANQIPPGSPRALRLFS